MAYEVEHDVEPDMLGLSDSQKILHQGYWNSTEIVCRYIMLKYMDYYSCKQLVPVANGV